MREVTRPGARWALPLTNSLTLSGVSPRVSLRLGFLPHETGLMKPTWPGGGRKQTTVTCEQGLQAKRCWESVPAVPVSDLVMSPHWLRKGTVNATPAEEGQGRGGKWPWMQQQAEISDPFHLHVRVERTTDTAFQQALSPGLLCEARGGRQVRGKPAAFARCH